MRLAIGLTLLFAVTTEAQAPPSLAQAITEARAQVQEQTAIVMKLPEYQRLLKLQNHLKLLEALAAANQPKPTESKSGPHGPLPTVVKPEAGSK
jgi:hypothetical protein